MSCLTLQSQPCPPLCFVCESAHRLRDLLSSLQICKRVGHDILKKVLSICETVFTFLCDHCPNCRTVVSLGLQSAKFFIDVLPNFAMATLSPLCFAMASAHRLWDLLSTLRICERVGQDIPKKLLWICGTVVTFLCGHCPNCRTVVSLGRFLCAATLKPSKSSFWGSVLVPEL